MSFDEVLELMKPRIEFHAKTKQNMINGLDYDDVYQEVSIILWKLLPKIPEDIEYLDFRFTRYADKVFTTRLYNVGRSKMVRSLYNKKIYRSKDLMDYCEELFDE